MLESQASSTTKQTFQLAALILLLVVAVIAVFIFVEQTLIAANGNRFDFYPRLVGTRAFWQGENPYDPSITARIQRGMFGEELRADEDQQRVAHPAYTFVLLAPLIMLTDSAAIALWSTLQLFALFATPFIWLAILDWQPRPLWVAALLLGCIFVFRYPIIVFVLGQFIGTIVFCLSLAVWLMQHHRHGWAGIVLVGATMPPTLGGGLALLLLGSAVVRGQWRGLISFVAVLGAIMLFTLARLGWWVPAWIETLRAYTDYANPLWAVGMLPIPLNIVAIIGIPALAGRELWRIRQDTSPQAFIDYICIILIGSLLLLPQTGSYVLSLLIPVIVVAAARISQQQKRWDWRWILVIAILFSPWLFLALPGGLRVEPLVQPLLAFVLWWITRIQSQK